MQASRNIRAKMFRYRPGKKATLALMRLMKFWEVKREDCASMEKGGFTILEKRGLVQLKEGVYLRPNFETMEELDTWFDWLEAALNIERKRPF